MPRHVLPTSTLDERVMAPQAGDPFGLPYAIDYTFGFADITGFSAFCEEEGEHAAIDLLSRFRFLTRSVAVRRGVRVAKWLGDGVMLVACDQDPLVATVGELCVRCGADGIDTHAGLARGPVLLFEGDDYVGRPVNLAARLCDAAGKGEMLSAGLAPTYPDWVVPQAEVALAVSGVGIEAVVPLGLAPEVAGRFQLEGVAA